MISIIIPTLNEEENLKAVLIPIANRSDCETIVVDGGSSDNTVQIAQAANIKTYLSRPSRATQMNIGAREAKGDVFLFLHADTILPDDFADHIKTVLGGNGIVAGAFELAIDHPGTGCRVVEKTANARSRFLQLPYGDQAIFISKQNFTRYGGFDEVVFLEDVVFVRHLQKYGKIAVANAKVMTSGRRWKQVGVLKTTFLNQLIIVGYLLGFPIPFLKKLYGVVQKG